MIHLNVSIASRNRAEKLACQLVTDSVNVVDAVDQLVGYDVVRGPRRGLGRAYSTVPMPYPGAMTRVCGAAARSVR